MDEARLKYPAQQKVVGIQKIKGTNWDGKLAMGDILLDSLISKNLRSE